MSEYDLELGPTDDPEILEESLEEARYLLEEALDTIAEAAYVIGVVRGLLPTNEDGDVVFDEEDLRNSEHASLVAIAKVAKAIDEAFDTLPDPPEDEDEDGDEEDAE